MGKAFGRCWLVLSWCITSHISFSQCLTDFTKLLPDPALDYSQSFARSLAMHDDYLAVGIPTNDSLGHSAGLVHIYQKGSSGWVVVAKLAPSTPSEGLLFGVTLAMSENYLAVGAEANGGKVYLFKKPAGGWTDQTEFTTFSVSGSSYLGVFSTHPIEISPDEQTIVITDPYRTTGVNPNRFHGEVYVYHKQVAEEWSGEINPFVVTPPHPDAVDFGRGGVEVQGDRLAIATPYAPSGNGMIYVYRDISGEFDNLALEASLSAGATDQSEFFAYTNFVFTDDGIFAASSLVQPSRRMAIHFFEKPSSGSWASGTPGCHIFEYSGINSYPYIDLSLSGDGIVAANYANDGSGSLRLLKKGPGGWCDAQMELLDSYSPPADQYVFGYGEQSAASSQGTHVVVGMVPHPGNLQAPLALKALSKLPGNGWESQLIYQGATSTAGHSFGHETLSFGDYLFVSAARDGAVKKNAGAIFTYQRVGESWQQTGKILPVVKDAVDDVFGSALATDGRFLAVGAFGYEPKGKVFIYKKTNADWSDPELWQEIVLPEDKLTVYIYGEYLAMNSEWLVIPYVQNDPARMMLAIYRLVGEQWEYFQFVETGFGNIFAKQSSVAVDIEGDIIVAGPNIIEWDPAAELWIQKYQLSPSDPESARMSPNFTHWLSNGSTFGHDVDIEGNTIFISAPTKDHEETWDVGAVYVFTKMPWEKWSSRTESAKLLPRVKAQSELFGYSIKAFENTLIVGAPGADQLPDQTARNLPGRAYVFQAADYHWKEVTPLIDFTGDTFNKDYFGITVGLNQHDFLVSALIEDLPTGKRSGSVYATPVPPVLRLVPAVCDLSEPVELLGYPFSGLWSGPGITDAAEGIFDPELAGPGDHYLTYTTESCAYQGRLKIQVASPPAAVIQGENTACEEKPVYVALSAQTAPNQSYRWYYRSAPDSSWQLEGDDSTFLATKRGDYQLFVSNEACESHSELLSIQNEQQVLQLDSLARICASSTEGMPLTASPGGGVWSGPGVTENKLYTNQLPNGEIDLQYKYTSARGCEFTDTLSVLIDRLQAPVIDRSAGHLCEEGEVVLHLKGTAEAGTIYEWMHQPAGSTDFVLAGNGAGNDVNLTTTERGTYQLMAYSDGCEIGSNTYFISDSTFRYTFSPAAALIDLCYGQSVELAFSDSGNRRYRWYFAEEIEEEAELLTSTAASFMADRQGYYWAEIEAGICYAKTTPLQVVIQPADSVWLPNVFSPNGDGFNEMFEVITNQEQAILTVFGRSGERIFSGPASQGWTGEDAMPAVYFWNVSYTSCEGDKKLLRGTVQLMR